ncbi:MAG: hypothetical protein RBU45_13535 [Myxococcota bacterium]|nr:hypothetical protein [Myxococcota bacterium]
MTSPPPGGEQQQSLLPLLDPPSPRRPASPVPGPAVTVPWGPALLDRWLARTLAALLRPASGDLAPPPWLVPASPPAADGFCGWVGLQLRPGHFRVLLLRLAGATVRELFLFVGDERGLVLRRASRPADEAAARHLLRGLAGPSGKGCVALSREAARRLGLRLGAAAGEVAQLLALPATEVQLPWWSQPELLARTARLLELPQYLGWSLPGLPEPVEVRLPDVDELDPEASSVPPDLTAPIRRLLAALEGGGWSAALQAALRHNLSLHRQQGDLEVAGLVEAALAPLQTGLALVEHPFVEALARRSLLVAGGRAGRRLLTQELASRLAGSGSSPGTPAGLARERRRLLLATAWRASPGFGLWPGAPGSPEGLDQLALRLADDLLDRDGEAAAREVESPGERRAGYRALLAKLGPPAAASDESFGPGSIDP